MVSVAHLNSSLIYGQSTCHILQNSVVKPLKHRYCDVLHATYKFIIVFGPW